MASLGRQELKNVEAPLVVYKGLTPWSSSKGVRSQFAHLALDRRRVAILPMRNMSADPDDEYFAEGMTEELISTICTISRLRVVSRTSVMRYRGATDRGVPQIGRELRRHDPRGERAQSRGEGADRHPAH
jgi:hypothetical protein